MGCTSECMKCVLNLFNTLFAITGICLIALGVLIFNSAPPFYVYFLFIVGSFNLVASLLGCCGVCHENVCMTATYAILILASLVAQVYIKINPTQVSEVTKIAHDMVNKSWELEKTNPGAMDKTQQTFDCCGVDGPNNYYQIGRLVLPASCYPDNTINQATGWYSDGCLKSTEHHFLSLFKYTASGEWGVIAVTSIMLFFAIYLVFRFRNRENRYRY